MEGTVFHLHLFARASERKWGRAGNVVWPLRITQSQVRQGEGDAEGGQDHVGSLGLQLHLSQEINAESHQAICQPLALLPSHLTAFISSLSFLFRSGILPR